MNYYLNYIKDISNSNYIGINIYVDMVYPFLDKMKSILSEEYDVYKQHQQNRDNGKYHITVINVGEYNKLSKDMDKFINSLESVLKYEIDDLKFMGLGSAEKNGNKSYFIVISSEKLNAVRKKYNLPDQDFHITIGFKYKDVFGVRKNEILPDSNNFIKLLKREYYNQNETFEFIKGIENFDGDHSKDIEPIEILDNRATFRNGDIRYMTVSVIDDVLRITAKWEDNKKLPILPNTLISKKFK